MDNKPLLIVISSNRNYGWIVPLFLAANSRWADYIIITDQMSTDGSREKYTEYSNVIVVDDPEMSFKESTRAKMSFEIGRKIANGRDAIYFALDIDEILPQNWLETEDGKKILNSKPGDMFGLRWVHVLSDNQTCIVDDKWEYKVFHDSGIEWENNKSELHVPHLPFSTYSVEPTKIMDFPNLHFGHYNTMWRKYNGKFYGMLDVHQKRSKSVVSINREYYYPKPNKISISLIQSEWLSFGFNIFELIDLNVKPQGIFLIKELIAQDGIEKFLGVDIWDEELCYELQINDPRTLGWKLLHYYLRKTQRYRYRFIIRAIDKIIKTFIK